MSDVTEFKRDNYYKALREYGLPHHLAETIVDEFYHACNAMFIGAQINKRLTEDNARLTAELAAKQATIDLFMKCMRRTNQLWREAHPDKPLELPDGAEAFVWLKEQVDAIKERRCATCEHATEKWEFGHPMIHCNYHALDLECGCEFKCLFWQAKEAPDA